MGVDTVDDRSSPSDERKPQNGTNRHGLMTPARRAALDALERELHELMKAHPR